MKRILQLLFTFALLISAQQLSASHYMGGEITWQCISSGPDAGKFIFQMKVYRECYSTGGSSAAQFLPSQTIHSNSPANNGTGDISLTEISGWPKDISPQCHSGSSFSHISCVGMTNAAANKGAVQEHIYRSSPVTLYGVPPASGWTFYWHDCCRNPATNVVNASSKYWYLRAKMYPFHNQNTFPCFDNSPSFAEVPRTVICAGYPFAYNHNAYDKELDKLTFAWGQPMMDAYSPLPYAYGYSYTNPLPGTMQNPNNVPGAIDPNTGDITFTSYTTGAYVTSVKVTAWRCGIKIAEIWRDIQVVLLSCGTNSPPIVIPPFANGTSYIDTVYAGEYVSFALNAQDIEYLSNGLPQTMSIVKSGAEFGSFIPPTATSQATLSATTGCLSASSTPPAPCATLLPAPGPGYPLTSVFGIQTQFGWQTTCGHLATNIGCGVTSNIYTFVLKVSDDYCPAPAINIATMKVVVLPKPTIPSPPIQCLQILPSGDVKLHWSVPSDTMNTFDSYHIFHSNNRGGPYVEIDSIFNINVNTYTHVGANALNTPNYYKLVAKAGCPGHLMSSVADTFSTIRLNVINNMAGTAIVTWNPTINPLLSTSSGVYNVGNNYPNGLWHQVGSSIDTSYSEPITACGDNISYAVAIADSNVVDSTGAIGSCISNSNIDSDYFADIVPPSIPSFDSVSVNTSTGFAELAWDVNQAGDDTAYVVYLLINGAMTPIDTVWGRYNTVYIDQNHSACNGNGNFNTYAIAAIDSCGNISALGEMQNTISLKAEKAICDDMITLTWNSYHNMKAGLNHYEIFVSENSGPIMLLSTTMPGDTTFEHIGLINNANYCYFVRAVSDSATSTSCQICQVANKPNQPQFGYIRSVSVIPGNSLGVMMRLYTDTTAKVSRYRIQRSDNAVSWRQIDSLPPDYQHANLTYVDASALVQEKAYFYRFIVVDSCGLEALTSNVARTILLDVKANDSLYNKLRWNEYRGYDGSPTVYDIYRAVDGVWNPSPIISLPATQHFYKDDVSAFKDQGGMFNYLISAVEGQNNQFGFVDTSLSNTNMALQKPKMYLPSGFNPNSSESQNRTFKPNGSFINSKNYLMIIYNKWGEKIFESPDYNKGWDGKYLGQEVPEGVYTYYVRFTTSSGNLFESRGTVTLIR